MNVKKLNVLILIAFTVLMTCFSEGCTKEKNEIRVGDYYWDVFKKYDRIYGDDRISSFRENDFHTIVVSKNSDISTIIRMTTDRKVHKKQGQKIQLVDGTDINRYVGMTLLEIEEECGTIHADLGSGMHLPSYITKDGYLLILGVDMEDCVIYNNEIIEDSTVLDVHKVDLFTGKEVERAE